ncbi:UPAR/Ly6 domain-containing protein [Caenorhabditis elegans]|uniref:UPAR/Ly6 domain-containing protein n=1 Tax=Caenorhabditis elegans TaxID=6239 RepID=Q95QW3_CAEEL|nr:UPAR/Ly6 domain-containing protein [Caenorhabditis elegans]CCD64636.1 UPAR/Ly6 domain-containing protein [Caenorhabditis elegans]|eukprot:NP_509022.1 Uncharacterized protein CELE_C15H9.11 [Caenorhabditis elegans]
MFSVKVLAILIVVPVLVISFKCPQTDLSTNTAYSDCSANNYCTTIIEFNSDGTFKDEKKGCDNANCQGTGRFSSVNQYAIGGPTATFYNCCTGEHCNSATSKGLLALPIMILSYVIFK